MRALLGSAAKYSSFAVDYNFRQTSVAPQRNLISAGHTRAIQVLNGLAQTPQSPRLLFASETALILDRSLTVLARLDCPPEIGDPTEDGFTSRLPRLSDTLLGGRSGVFPMWVKNTALISGFFSVLSIVAFAVSALRARAKSLARRFICEIPVHYPSPDTSDETISGIAEDISRGGVKIGTIDGQHPIMNSLLTIQLGPVEKQLRVRWGNAHFFGGQFVKPFTRRELRTLLGRKKNVESRPVSKPKPKRVKNLKGKEIRQEPK